MKNKTRIKSESNSEMSMLWFNFIHGPILFPLFLCMVMYDNE